MRINIKGECCKELWLKGRRPGWVQVLTPLLTVTSSPGFGFIIHKNGTIIPDLDLKVVLKFKDNISPFLRSLKKLFRNER